MGVYNTTKIENWYDDFISARNDYDNKYSKYKSSYIRTCSDSAVVKMRNSLNKHYERISRINSRVKITWEHFINDLNAIDNRLAGERGRPHDDMIATKLTRLPTLKEFEASLSVRASSASAVLGIVDKVGWSEDKTFEENFKYAFKRTSATIATGGISVVEGIGIFGEGLIDAAAPIATEYLCFLNDIAGHIVGNTEYTDAFSEKMREDTRTFISEQHVKLLFDSFYDSSVGQWLNLKENAYGFDTARSVGNEIGVVVGAELLSAATDGIIPASVLYGVSKSGQYMEENMQDENNGYLKSILKGYAGGALDAMFYSIGKKGDKAVKNIATNLTKQTLQTGAKTGAKKTFLLFGKSIFEGGTAVAQDGANMLIDALFMEDNLVDPNGNKMEFNSYNDKLKYCYEQAGGLNGLITSFGTGSLLSFASDASDVFGKKSAMQGLYDDASKNLKNAGKEVNSKNIFDNLGIDSSNKYYDSLSDGFDKINKKYTKQAEKAAQKQAQKESKQFAKNIDTKKVEINSKSPKPKVDTDLNSLKKEYDGLMNWKNSEEGLDSKRFYEVYGDRFGVNNKYKKNMDRMTELEKILSSSNSANKSNVKNVDDFIIKHSSSSLSSKKLSNNFNRLNDSQKINFIKNNNVNKLEYAFSDVKSIEKYKDIIDDKIIKNQNNLFYDYFSKADYMLFGKNYENMINYISNDSSVLKNISDENLIILLLKEKWVKFKNPKKIISEIENRIMEGKFDFYNRDFLISNSVAGKMSAYNLMTNSISNDTCSILIKNMKEAAENLPLELKNIDYGDYGLFKKVGLTNMHSNGRLDSNSIEMINDILTNNKKGMSNFNIELLDKDIVKNFDYQTLNQIGNDYKMSKQIIDLYNNNRNLFDSFTDVMRKSSKDNSLNTFYIKSKSYLNYIYENSEMLSKIDKSVLTDDSFINYVLYNQNTYSLENIDSKKIRLDYTKNYDKEFDSLCDNMFDKAVGNNNLKQAKEAYFQKYFSISSDESKNFISKYGDHFDEVMKYDSDGTVTTIINTFKKIDESSDINFIKEIYDTQKFNLSAEEMIHIDSKIKEVYSQSYVEKLSLTQKNIKNMIDTPNMHEVVNYNGKTVNIIDYNDDFNFLVHSSDTGFTMDKVLVNDSYIDTWKSISPDTHALSTSYITESNIGSAPVKNKGVLYGFTDINVNDIGVMAPYDVNSHIADYGFGSANKQMFVSADQMSNNTYRVYNEVVLDRQSVKPTCVIIYKDMPQESLDSAIKAASEWDIPVVRIDKVELANNQLNQIRNSLDDFKTSGNMESLKNALDKYESNVSGYKLNAYVKEGHKDATAAIDNSIVSNLFKSSEVENSLLDVIGNMHDKNQINELINHLENMKEKYNILNDGGTSLVANTKESFDIDTLINIAKEKIGGI